MLLSLFLRKLYYSFSCYNPSYDQELWKTPSQNNSMTANLEAHGKPKTKIA